MAQTFTSTEVTTGTNVFGDNQSQRVNENTLRSNFSGSSQPSDPVIGQHWYDTGNNREMTYNGTAWVAVDTNTATQVDVKNSAGNLSNLKSFLSVAHNDDGTLKVTPTSSIDEFKENSIVVTYVNPTTFTTPNDLTGIFTQYRKVKVYLSASTAISSVSSSSYDGTSNVTTVVLSTSAMDATLVNIRYSIVQYGTPDEYLEKSGGSITGNISWTGEKRFINSDLKTGFFANDLGTGLFDWKNNRGVVDYNQSANAIYFGNASTVSTFSGAVNASTFSGHLVGTADKATADKNGADIADTYFPKTGGTIAGDINWTGSKRVFNSNSNIGLFASDTSAGIVDWKNGRAALWYTQSTNEISLGNSLSVTTLGGSVHATLDSTSTLNGYTAAQLIGETSHATNGYHKFPGGTVVQWGYAAAPGSYSFPIAFPNTCLSVSLTAFTPTPSTSGDNGSVVLQSKSASGFTYTKTDDPNNFPVSYIAIGY